eukprot:59900-Prymnesium_polylepis.1
MTPASATKAWTAPHAHGFARRLLRDSWVGLVLSHALYGSGACSLLAVLLEELFGACGPVRAGCLRRHGDVEV